MIKLEHSMFLGVGALELFRVAKDYSRYPKYFPAQIKSVQIMSDSVDMIQTREILVFSSIISRKIIQESIHHIMDNEIVTDIISGPFKKSQVRVRFDPRSSGCQVCVFAKLAVSPSYRLFSGVIKKIYRNYLTSLLYKMANEVESSSHA